MNENLKNYSNAPDPEVWSHIKSTTRRAYLRRQAATAVAGMAIVAVAITATIVWPHAPQQPAPSPATELAQLSPATAPQMETEATASNPAASIAPAMATPAQASEPLQQAKNEAIAATQNSPTAEQPAAQATEPTLAAMPAQRPAVTTTPAMPQVTAVANVEQAASAPVESKPTTKIGNNAPASAVQDTILWIPNIFAPASDNPELVEFRPRLNKSEVSIRNYRLTIFNRSGHQVFRSNDINYGWDGSYKGTALPQASYVYVINYTDKDGLTHQRKGTITLVR